MISALQKMETDASVSQTQPHCLTVAFLGVPNAGKSTLLNSILQENLAAVHRKPQMTRRNLLGILTQKNYQIIFIDTPGIHQSDNRLNKIMRQQLDEALTEADCICVLLEVNFPVAPELDEFLKQNIASRDVLILLNKMDLRQKEWVLSLEKLQKQYACPVYGISALSGEGVKPLVEILKTKANPHPFFYHPDDLTVATCRELACEYIREQVMEYLHQEIPYQMGVVIDSYQEKAKQVSIKAVIVVNKESHKGMVLGKKGTTIDKIRKGAIQKIKAIAGCPVRLSLFVKVDENWIKNSLKIKEYF